MTLTSELTSWFSPEKQPSLHSAPSINTPAPRTPNLHLDSNRPTIIAFLRHCGCPFAEKTFLNLRQAAKTHSDIAFIAVSHSTQEDTQTWLKSLPQFGSEPSNLRIVVDHGREIYAAYGLGTASWAHVLAPSQLTSVFNLSSKEGISNRATNSGSRWQTSGAYAIGADGHVKWGGPASGSADVPDFESAVRAL